MAASKCLFLLLGLVVAASACFITNCPKGGKRSANPLTSLRGPPTRPCPSCGPQGLGGRCVGPEICCSTEFGCLVGSPDTRACRQEVMSSQPCYRQGSPCSGGDLGIKGQCVTQGYCCSTETCTKDLTCHQRSDGSSLDEDNLSGEAIKSPGAFPEYY